METSKTIEFTAKEIATVENGPGFWNWLQIGIFLNGEPFGEPYVRNYSDFFNTFCYFEKNGRHFALYSADYTATRIMELFPDQNRWQDIGGEERSAGGFCPVDLYVPPVTDCCFEKQLSEAKLPVGCKVIKHPSRDPKDDSQYGVFCEIYYPPTFGFVAGCIWGDDSSWKIEYLDLSRVEEGILKRDNRFGYIVLPEGLTLAKAIGEEGEIEHHWIDRPEPFVRIATVQSFSLKDPHVKEVTESGEPISE